ncbi:Rhomboid-like protein 15 [Orchesella cincta]|uniref:Rhomboid-like protein 15 n=1 Tax=Orchesella cincta TaxID=48709 RepID=A0A1D2NE18_ORCCI|nr:Rhomboid-like protein 15 [Orchesella cincta]
MKACRHNLHFRIHNSSFSSTQPVVGIGNHVNSLQWRHMPSNRIVIHRSSVKVRVHFESEPSSRSANRNNNKGRILGLVHPVDYSKDTDMPEFELPPVSTFFSSMMIALYLFREYINITDEEDVYVSWNTVVTKGEVWRLFYAQFFHFVRVLIFFNVITLMSIGRYLEKKIQMQAFIVLIMLMSAISNLLYLFFNEVLCSGPNTEYTVGFATCMFSLRMIHIFTMDPDANNGKGEPNLIFGFLPLHLPKLISPWQPLMETIVLEVAIFGRCVASNIAGMCAGLIFPYLMKHFRHLIMFPRDPPPPPPPSQRARTRSFNTISLHPSVSSRNNNNYQDPVDDYEYDD